MLGWLGLNAFLVTLATIAGGSFFVLFSLVRWLDPSQTVERYLGALAAVLALVITFFAAKWLYRLLDRHVVNRGVRRVARP